MGESWRWWRSINRSYRSTMESETSSPSIGCRSGVPGSTSFAKGVHSCRKYLILAGHLPRGSKLSNSTHYAVCWRRRKDILQWRFWGTTCLWKWWHMVPGKWSWLVCVICVLKMNFTLQISSRLELWALDPHLVMLPTQQFIQELRDIQTGSWKPFQRMAVCESKALKLKCLQSLQLFCASIINFVQLCLVLEIAKLQLQCRRR